MDDDIDLSDLSPEQADTDRVLRRLLGTAVADRYTDFCRLAAGTLPLTVSRPLAGHALRELDSLIRHVLAVPMDAVAPEDTKQEKLRADALKTLRSMDFDEHTLQRAGSALKPRSSHRQQIQRIVERLGLAPDGDVAKDWIALNDAYGRVHERSFHLSMKVDDRFRTEYAQRFDTVIRALAVQLESRYAPLMRRAKEIAGLPSAEGIKLFVGEIPGAVQIQGYFYQNLTSDDWLPLLKKNGLLGEPLPDPQGDSDLRLWTWPVGGYLQRMAGSSNPATRQAVIEAVRALAASTHPDVQHRGMDVIAALPAAEAASLADVVAGWLASETLLHQNAPHELIALLAQEGHIDAALQVAGAVFQVFEREGQLATLFEHHMYEHYLTGAVNELAMAGAQQAIPLFCDLLRQVMRIEKHFSGGPEEDYTYFAAGPLATDDLAGHGVGGALVAAVINLAKAAVASDRAALTSIVETVLSYQARIYRRIALHVLAIAPDEAPTLAEAYLTDTTLIDSEWCAAEYAELANTWFPSLSPSAQKIILDFIDAVPVTHRELFKASFEQYEKRPITDEDERKYRETTIRDIVWGWREALPSARREAVAATFAEFGDPDAWHTRHFATEESPLTPEAIRAQSIDETVAFLAGWRPEPGLQKHTASALSNALRQATNADPKAFSANATKFRRLRPVFIRGLLEGLQQSVANGGEITWAPLFALMTGITERAEAPAPDVEQVAGDDPNWLWTLRTMVEVLGSGLRGGVERLPNSHIAVVPPLAFALYHRVSTIRLSEGEGQRDEKHVFFSAQRTPRGAAIELCVLLLWWLKSDPEGAIGKSPRDALALTPDLRRIFETELADRSAAGWIPRAILGRYLTWLFYFGEGWLREQIYNLFPPEDKPLRYAAWLAHLQSDKAPLAPLLDALRECYADQIKSLGADASTNGDSTSTHLAEYLMALYLHDALPEDLLKQFWACAPLPVRRRAMWYMGRHLTTNHAQIKERAISYWDRRLSLAIGCDDPDAYRNELGTIGQFFYWKVDPGWLMEQLLRMLKAGFAPNDPIGIIDGLAKQLPDATDRVVEITNALVKHPLVNSWIFLAQEASLRQILLAGKLSASAVTQATVQEIISLLAARGNTGFLDLAVP